MLGENESMQKKFANLERRAEIGSARDAGNAGRTRRP